MCTREEFTEFVATMKCIYTLPTFLPDCASAEGWYLALRHFEYADLKRAFTAYYPVNTFPPTPADLIGLLISPVSKTAIRAWSEVEHARKNHGPTSEVKAHECVDDFTNKVIKDIGGWEIIRACPPENRSFLMRQFISAYDDCVQQETINLLPDTLKRSMLGGDSTMMLEGVQL